LDKIHQERENQIKLVKSEYDEFQVPKLGEIVLIAALATV
jgi:hypothetical protein